MSEGTYRRPGRRGARRRRPPVHRRRQTAGSRRSRPMPSLPSAYSMAHAPGRPGGSLIVITKFSNVYAGHVDLPDMGQNATPANERRYPNEHLASVFEKTEAIAQCMDDHGFHTLWLAEHHFQHEGYEVLPNILMIAVHLAHLTQRLRIGCGFNITPTR